MATTKTISSTQVEYEEEIDAAYEKYHKAIKPLVKICEEKINIAEAEFNKSIAPVSTEYGKERTAALVKYQKANQSK